MFTIAEKKYLALTLAFLAAGSGIKAYRHSQVQIGPMEDPRILASDSSQGGSVKDSLPGIGPSVYAGSTDSLNAHRAVSNSAAAILPEGSPVRDWSSEVKPAEPSRHPASAHPRSGSGRKADFTGKISLNRAGPGELTAIRGIGEKTAQVIVQYRLEHGPFRELRDLLQVKGIGEKKLEKIVPFLIL